MPNTGFCLDSLYPQRVGLTSCELSSHVSQARLVLRMGQPTLPRLVMKRRCDLQNDSIEGIYDTLKECAAISKSAGGIGVSIHNIRATVRIVADQTVAA